MAARGTFKLSNPLKVEMTLTITMSMEEWTAIKAKLNRSNDAEWALDDSIGQMLDKANQHFNFYEEVGKFK